MITDTLHYVQEPLNLSLPYIISSVKSSGFSRVVICTDETLPSEFEGVWILQGKIIQQSSGKIFFDSIKKAPKNSVVMVTAGENSFNRTAISTKGVHLLTGISDLPKGGFDHIIAKMATEKNVGVLLDISKIIDGRARRPSLSKYAEILKLQRKFGFPLVIGTGAQDIFGIRNVTEVSALCSLFGMTESEVMTAFSSLDNILSPPKTVTTLTEDL